MNKEKIKMSGDLQGSKDWWLPIYMVISMPQSDFDCIEEIGGEFNIPNSKKFFQNQKNKKIKH